jgi:hypothetical protein
MENSIITIIYKLFQSCCFALVGDLEVLDNTNLDEHTTSKDKRFINGLIAI